jgi:hypothetical protein
VSWPDVYVALVHWPVLNKDRQVVTTSITCFDLHDIARTALTYGARGYFVQNPLPSQQKLAGRITRFWREGPSADWNPTRRDAFGVVRIVETIEQACRVIEEETGRQPRVVVTSARRWKESIPYSRVAGKIRQESHPWLIIFGTGWGLADEVIQQADYVLEPIEGAGEYNHLPVRSAVAISLDRLLTPGESLKEEDSEKE